MEEPARVGGGGGELAGNRDARDVVSKDSVYFSQFGHAFGPSLPFSLPFSLPPSPPPFP
jgi:hypothetical protein